MWVNLEMFVHINVNGEGVIRVGERAHASWKKWLHPKCLESNVGNLCFQFNGEDAMHNKRTRYLFDLIGYKICFLFPGISHVSWDNWKITDKTNKKKIARL